MGALIGS